MNKGRATVTGLYRCPRTQDPGMWAVRFSVRVSYRRQSTNPMTRTRRWDETMAGRPQHAPGPGVGDPMPRITLPLCFRHPVRSRGCCGLGLHPHLLAGCAALRDADCDDGGAPRDVRGDLCISWRPGRSTNSMRGQPASLIGTENSAGPSARKGRLRSWSMPPAAWPRWCRPRCRRTLWRLAGDSTGRRRGWWCGPPRR